MCKATGDVHFFIMLGRGSTLYHYFCFVGFVVPTPFSYSFLMCSIWKCRDCTFATTVQIHSWIFLTKSHCISKRNWATVVPESTFFSAYTMQFVTGQTARLGPHTLMTSDFNTCMCVCRGANCVSLSWKSMHHFGIYLEVQFSIFFVLNSFLDSKCTKCYLYKQNTKRKKLNKTKEGWHP